MADPVKGNSGIVFKITGTDPVVAVQGYDDDVKAVRVTQEDKDDSDLTFAEAAAGNVKDVSVVVTATQDTAVGGLWRLLWDNPGLEGTLDYGPHGNAVATANKPHFLGTIKASGQPELGAEAARDGKRADFEYTFTVDGVLTLDDGA